MERVFITLFVRGGPLWGEVESWAWTMYCSFRMSWGRGARLVGEVGEGWGRWAYHDSDDGVVVGIVDVVG